MSTPVFVGFVDGVELESFRAVASRKEALEFNPSVFDKEESVQVCMEYYETTAHIIARHPEWELASYPEFNISPDSGGVFASEDYN